MRGLHQIELAEVDLLLHLLERGVPDRAAVAQVDEPPPLRGRSGAHDFRIFRIAVPARFGPPQS